MKKYIIIYKLVRTSRTEIRMACKEANSNLEAIMKFFDNCPYTNRFELISCTEGTDDFIEYHRIR